LFSREFVVTVKPSGQVQRLVVFVEHYPPFLGTDRTIFELSKRVAERGVKVHFIATQPLRYLVGRRPPAWEYKENWTRPPPKIHDNITARHLVLDQRAVGLWLLIAPLAYVLTVVLFTGRAIKEVVRFGPDLIIAANASPIVGMVALLSAKLTVHPLFMGCPDWMTAYAAGLTGQKMNSLGMVLLHIVEMRLYKWATRVFAVTDFLKRLLTRYSVDPNRIDVIPNGVDTQQFSPSVEGLAVRKKYRLEERCVVLLSGHLEEWAGVSLVYDLAMKLDREFPKSNVLLVGTGSSITPLFEKLFKDRLAHMVTYAGLQPFEEMPEFTGASDIALCIFPNTPVSHAASPLKVFEYMGAGKAIVATRVAGTVEVLDDNTGVLVPPGDVEALCGAVVNLCRDPELRKRIGANARLLAERKYSWQRLAEVFMDACIRAATRQQGLLIRKSNAPMDSV